MASKPVTRIPGRAFRPRPGHQTYTARRARVGYLFVLPAVIMLALVSVYPLLYNAWLSLHHDVLTDPLATHFSGLANYHLLLTDSEFWGDFLRTLIFTVISVAIELVLGMVLALVVSRKFRARSLVRASILIPWAIPTAVSAMLWKMFFDQRTGFVDFFLGLLHLPGSHEVWFNSPFWAWLPIILSDMWKNTPFVALLLLAGLQGIPHELYESARIDGANAWQIFWRVTVPLMKPTILVALIFRTLSALLIFDTIFVMTGGGPGISTEVVSYYNWYQFMTSLNFGYGAAISVGITIIAMALAFLYVRLMRQGGGFQV